MANFFAGLFQQPFWFNLPVGDGSWILEGRRVAPGRKAGGGKSELRRARCRVTWLRQRRWDTRGRQRREPLRRTVPQKIRPPLRATGRVRVKRWCKRPPPQAQARGHGKPHRVQGQIGDPGAARSTAKAGSRVLAAQTNDSLRRATGADRIRLTALPKSLSCASGGPTRSRGR